MNLVISCEHAVNAVPEKYAPLFHGQRKVLASHLAYDLGAADLAGTLAEACKAPLFLASVTRLVVDCNRSVTHRRLFSRFSHSLPPLEKEAILTRWYLPYRDEILRAVQSSITRAGRCLHLSVHSFTPQLHGKERKADIGLLYAPTRSQEQRFACALRQEIVTALPFCRVRHNYPYRGVSDGLTTALRGSLKDEQYLGIELEMNQGLLTAQKRWPASLLQALSAALIKTTAKWE